MSIGRSTSCHLGSSEVHEYNNTNACGSFTGDVIDLTRKAAAVFANSSYIIDNKEADMFRGQIVTCGGSNVETKNVESETLKPASTYQTECCHPSSCPAEGRGGRQPPVPACQKGRSRFGQQKPLALAVLHRRSKPFRQ